MIRPLTSAWPTPVSIACQHHGCPELSLSDTTAPSNWKASVFVANTIYNLAVYWLTQVCCSMKILFWNFIWLGVTYTQIGQKSLITKMNRSLRVKTIMDKWPFWTKDLSPTTSITLGNDRKEDKIMNKYSTKQIKKLKWTTL